MRSGNGPVDGAILHASSGPDRKLSKLVLTLMGVLTFKFIASWLEALCGSLLLLRSPSVRSSSTLEHGGEETVAAVTMRIKVKHAPGIERDARARKLAC
jgi:hypothetical protein